MTHAEHIEAQFIGWEPLGRGELPAAPYPVHLEPPFREFTGYCPLPRRDFGDEGRKPTLVTRLLGLGTGRIVDSKPEAEESEDSSSLQFEYLERESVWEIAVTLPEGLQVSATIAETFLKQLSYLHEPISMEFVGIGQHTELLFTAGDSDVESVIGLLRSHYPDAVFLQRRSTLASSLERLSPTEGRVLECSLGREFHYPLAQPSLDPHVGLVGALAGLGDDEFGILQVLIQPTSHPWKESLLATAFDEAGDRLPWLPAEMAKGAAAKAPQPLFATVVRLAAGSARRGRVWPILTQLAAPLQLLADPNGNFLTPVGIDDEYPQTTLIEDVVTRNSRRFGFLLTANELSGIVHLPDASVRSPTFSRHVTRTKAAPASFLGSDGLYLGENEHHGETRPVYLPAETRVRHAHVIGKSGSGKTNFLLNSIVDDIEAGEGLAVLDPHGDLITAVLGRIPKARRKDVVLIDPSDEEFSVAFNILSAHSDAERRMLASDLVSVFERLSTTWGDQMNIVLRNAILAFLESTRGGTLSDLRRFLVDDAYRRDFLPSITDADIRYYWEKTFPQFNSKTSVGAVVTRLETFLAPKPVRYVVSQPNSSVDFSKVMDEGKILLCRLSQGMIGKENAYLFGSLIVTKIQQSAMSRQRVEASDRRDFWCYIDEFQNFITPSLSEMLTEARKYRLGLILAHQNLTQIQKLPDVRAAVLSEPATRVVFNLGDADAKVFAQGFSGFDADDIQRLPIGHALVRVGRSDQDFNLQIPLNDPPKESKAEKRVAKITALSRERFSTPRAEIEASRLRELGLEPPAPDSETSAPKIAEASTPITEVPPETETGAKEYSAEASPAEASPESSDACSLDPDSDSEQTSNTEPPTSKLPGKGGEEHRKLQQEIRALAHEGGYQAEIEAPLPGGKSIDVLLAKDDKKIAIEVSLSGSIEHELANVAKCLEANLDTVLVLAPRKARRRRINGALREKHPDWDKVECISESDLRRFLCLDEPEPPEPTEDKKSGFTLIREYAEDSEEARRKDEEALDLIAKIMRGEQI